MDIQSNLAVPIKTLKEAKEIVGGWTVTSKMPTISWSTPAQACKTGSKLRLIENTVCSDCYAMKGNYVRYAKNVLPALYRRLDSLSNPRWVEAMIFIMKHQKSVVTSGLFRWHDSGDIQNIEHLDKIVKIAIATPEVKHWLPTKESNLIVSYRKQWLSGLRDPLPKNLVIRLSGTFVDGKAPTTYSHSSTVVSNKDVATCRAFDNDGKCGDCRQCWDSTVKNVSYANH